MVVSERTENTFETRKKGSEEKLKSFLNKLFEFKSLKDVTSYKCTESAIE